MGHPVDELQAEAQAAIAAMKVAALKARLLHARAELLRHMRTTAAKTVSRPPNEAAELVAREWMQAWHLDAGAYPELAQDVQAFTLAFCSDARASTRDTRDTIGTSLAQLEAAFLRKGTTLADEMAFRSQCAHGWWSLVVPLPAELHKADRSKIPRVAEHAPFWSAAARDHCM